MYTRCPHCSTYFAVNTDQLSAANGRVRCGTCLSIFDGLKFLTEKPPGGGAEVGKGESVPSKPLQNLENSGPWEVPVDQAAFEAGTAKREAKKQRKRGRGNEDMPEVIREDIARAEAERRGRWKTFVLTPVALVLLVALALQFAWFNPARVLAGYPEVRSWLEKFCAYTGCRVPDRRDPSKIKMLARDVRVHPAYEGALLVSATLVNTAGHPQPYPRVEFRVFNVHGQTIASRTFKPEEYLSSDLDPNGDMAPGKPLQIALELIAPAEAAISYEFRFL